METPVKILIIDDDQIDRMAVRRMLRASDLAVDLVEAEDSVTGLAALQRTRFDCVLLDFRLPGADGLSVLHSIHASGTTLPVIVMTGQGDEETAVEIMKAGASDYLAKGKLAPEILASSVRYALRVQRVEAERIWTEERLRFLAELSQMLVSSLDYEANLRSLATLSVPPFADWCAVDVVEEQQLRRLAVAGLTDPVGPAAPLPSDYPVPMHCSAHEVIRSGTTEHRFALQADDLACLSLEQQQLLGESATLLCVPLTARDRTLGTLTFIRGSKRPGFDSDDSAFAEEVARRAALAVDNALLYREARDALHTRDAFLSIAAHELKTPLTSLLGYVNLLQRWLGNMPLNDREAKALRVVSEQARRLNRMVTSLLDLSRLQTGQFTIEQAPVDLVALTRRVLDEMLPILDQHTLHLKAPAQPLIVLGDELRLEQVLLNLLQNAIKYSPQGGTIILTLEQCDADVVLGVADSGVGIPQDALPRVFWRFYRAANAAPYQVSGMGVGLYVVKQIIELHGGRVGVESVEGSGSTFTVTLPLAEQAAAVNGLSSFVDNR